jgi:hypothetical protein
LPPQPRAVACRGYAALGEGTFFIRMTSSG